MITKMNYEDKYRHYHSIGDTETANDYALLADLELQVENFEDLLEAEKESGYDRGFKDGKDQNLEAEIIKLKKKNTDLKQKISTIRTNLNIFFDWFSSDQIKNASGRKELTKILRSYILTV